MAKLPVASQEGLYSTDSVSVTCSLNTKCIASLV